MATMSIRKNQTAAATAAGITRSFAEAAIASRTFRSARALSGQRSRYRRSSLFGAGCDSKFSESTRHDVVFIVET